VFLTIGNDCIRPLRLLFEPSTYRKEEFADSKDATVLQPVRQRI
jgi:hypothetical protein